MLAVGEHIGVTVVLHRYHVCCEKWRQHVNSCVTNAADIARAFYQLHGGRNYRAVSGICRPYRSPYLADRLPRTALVVYNRREDNAIDFAVKPDPLVADARRASKIDTAILGGKEVAQQSGNG